jgi:hypothetical protein
MDADLLVALNAIINSEENQNNKLQLKLETSISNEMSRTSEVLYKLNNDLSSGSVLAHVSHSSHRSHASHRSHYSHRSSMIS